MPRVAVKFQKILDVPTPEYGTDKSAGFDLAVAEDVSIWDGHTVMARTGLIIQAPVNHMILVAPRSSTWRKYGLVLGNTIGVVDEDFCGPEDEMFLCLHKPVGTRFSGLTHVAAGTRLGQGIFVPITRGVFQLRKEAIAGTRGGWGSTGV